MAPFRNCVFCVEFPAVVIDRAFPGHSTNRSFDKYLLLCQLVSIRAKPCFVTFSKSNAKALLTAGGHQKCNLQRKASHSPQVLRSSRSRGSRLPARSVLLSPWLRGVHWTPAPFGKVPLHPAQTVSVSMCDDGDDVLHTGRGIKNIVTVVTLCHARGAFFPKENLSAGVFAVGMKADTMITKQPFLIVM